MTEVYQLEGEKNFHEKLVTETSIGISRKFPVSGRLLQPISETLIDVPDFTEPLDSRFSDNARLFRRKFGKRMSFRGSTDVNSFLILEVTGSFI